MARKARKAQAAAQTEAPDHEGEGYHGDDLAPRESEDQIGDEPIAPVPGDEEAEAETEAQIALPRSVVAPTYKVRYRDRARAAGISGKAAKRSTWDWLAQEIAAECLTKNAKLRVPEFVALLAANGIANAEARWPNRSKGWEGRFRMTGRLALQRVVAEAGVLHFPDGEHKEAPAEWVAKHLH